MDTATKTGVDAAKTAIGDLIGNKIDDKITAAGKSSRRNLHSIRKKTTNNWWLEIALAPYKNGIIRNCKFAWYNFWW